jgi:uncharacterized protein (TIGR04255 family)
MTTPIPQFERPPLDEMVMGLQFEPLQNFHAAHLGIFWSRIRERYPYTEDQPPLVPIIELPEMRPVLPGEGASVEIMKAMPLPRCWFISEEKTELVQVQNDRFFRNWRQVQGNEPYPRFHRLIHDFNESWNHFRRFAEDSQIGVPKARMCEITYVNSIVRGAGWSNFGELDKVFTLLRPRDPKGFLPPPEVLSWQLKYKLPDNRGRLHVEMSPKFRGRDLQLILGLNLTARGAPASSSDQDVAAWFSLAHEWAVRAFADMTGPDAHKFWGMRP